MCVCGGDVFMCGDGCWPTIDASPLNFANTLHSPKICEDPSVGVLNRLCPLQCFCNHCNWTFTNKAYSPNLSLFDLAHSFFFKKRDQGSIPGRVEILALVCFSDVYIFGQKYVHMFCSIANLLLVFRCTSTASFISPFRKGSQEFFCSKLHFQLKRRHSSLVHMSSGGRGTIKLKIKFV